MIGYSEYIASISMVLAREKFALYRNETEIQNELNKIQIQVPSVAPLNITLLAFKKKMLSPDIVCFVSKKELDFALERFSENAQLLFGLGLEYAKAIENNNMQKHRLVLLNFVSESTFPKVIIDYVQDELAMRSTLVRGFSSFNYVGFPVLAELSSGKVYYFRNKPWRGRHLYSIGNEYARECFGPSLA